MTNPLSIDLLTASQPHLLASTLIAALDQGRPVLLNEMDYMNLVCVLEGAVYESGGEAVFYLDDWLESGLKVLRPRAPDSTTLDNPLAAVAILDRALADGLVRRVTVNRSLDGWKYLWRDAPSTGGYGITFSPDVDSAIYEECLQREHELLTLPVHRDHVRRLASFGSVPSFVEGCIQDSPQNCLGSLLVDSSDMVTSHRALYRWLRNEFFVPLRPKDLRRTNVFADAVAVDTAHTSVRDVLTLLDRHREWSVYRKLDERIEARKSGSGEIVVYAMEQVAGLVAAPLAWVVKLGSFVAKQLRAPR